MTSLHRSCIPMGALTIVTRDNLKTSVRPANYYVKVSLPKHWSVKHMRCISIHPHIIAKGACIYVVIYVASCCVCIYMYTMCNMYSKLIIHECNCRNISAVNQTSRHER